MLHEGKSGKAYYNPAIRKSMGDEPEPEHAAAEPGQHAHKIVVHHPDGKENPSPGKYHTETHKGDGAEPEHMDHESMQDVHDHMDQNMPEDGDREEELEEEIDPGIHDEVAARQSDDGAY